MPKYVIAKKCLAIDFVLVEADNEEQAILLAEQNKDLKRMRTELVWNGDLPKHEWGIELLEPRERPSEPSEIGIHEEHK